MSLQIKVAFKPLDRFGVGLKRQREIATVIGGPYFYPGQGGPRFDIRFDDNHVVHGIIASHLELVSLI
jgi:hypothetical protein